MKSINIKSNKYLAVLSTIKYWYIVVFVIIAIIIVMLSTKTSNATATNVVESENVSSEYELRLENIVCNIKGVISAKVMLSYDDYAKVSSDGSTNASNIIGVIVVRESNGSISTDMAIKNALQTLLNIETNKIKIIDGEM